MVRGCLFVWVGGGVCVGVSDPCFIQFALGSCYAGQINIMKVYIERKKMQVK